MFQMYFYYFDLSYKFQGLIFVIEFTDVLEQIV